MRTLQGMRMKTEYMMEQMRIDAINEKAFELSSILGFDDIIEHNID